MQDPRSANLPLQAHRAKEDRALTHTPTKRQEKGRKCHLRATNPKGKKEDNLPLSHLTLGTQRCRTLGRTIQEEGGL